MCFISQNSLCNKNLLKTQNPQLINKRGFKLRAAYDGAHTVIENDKNEYSNSLKP